MASSGATIVGIYGVLLLAEYKEIETAIKTSLEEAKYVNEEVVYLKNSKNMYPQKPVLEIPKLSARMTSMSWTFSKPLTDPYPDVVPQNLSQNETSQISLDIDNRNEQTISNIYKDSVDTDIKSAKFVKCSEFTVNDEKLITKQPLRRIKCKDIFQQISPKDAQISIASEENSFTKGSVGNVSKIREIFEAKENLPTTQIPTTNDAKDQHEPLHSSIHISNVDYRRSEAMKPLKYLSREQSPTEKNKVSLEDQSQILNIHEVEKKEIYLLEKDIDINQRDICTTQSVESKSSQSFEEKKRWFSLHEDQTEPDIILSGK